MDKFHSTVVLLNRADGMIGRITHSVPMMMLWDVEDPEAMRKNAYMNERAHLDDTLPCLWRELREYLALRDEIARIHDVKKPVICSWCGEEMPWTPKVPVCAACWKRDTEENAGSDAYYGEEARDEGSKAMAALMKVSTAPAESCKVTDPRSKILDSYWKAEFKRVWCDLQDAECLGDLVLSSVEEVLVRVRYTWIDRLKMFVHVDPQPGITRAIAVKAVADMDVLLGTTNGRP